MEIEEVKGKLQMENEEALKNVSELQRQIDAKQKLEMEIEELKGKLQRVKEEALKKVLELKSELDVEQKLHMEIEELKGKLQVMKHSGDEDDSAVQEQIKKRNVELEAKTEEMEEMIEALFFKERQSNNELQDARKEMIKGLHDMLQPGRTNIGVKRMGEIDSKALLEACKDKFDIEEAQIKALELCTLWQDKVNNPEWHPVKVVAVDGAHKEVIDENDELLKNLKAEWGNGVFDAVVTAFKEMNEYNPSDG
ncbi:hypothetical protein M8C21_016303 [Ambrosia artemisiifolia]|uniref:Factor of DNA methylation 1-5/IDN2 domain-containing protein n=1 Tax=Ambrosia artemisiifolia TaxID=4212 RepID=A0AAD5GNL9_AMBAR|nr:hypothetical protein M8C21_016303 [Ambrosia artemisiifolia]